MKNEKRENFFPKGDSFRKLWYNGLTLFSEGEPMFRKFLNPDNALMITMTQITDCIFLSLFFGFYNIAAHEKGADTKNQYQEDNGQDINKFFHNNPSISAFK